MPYARPSLTQLRDLAVEDIETADITAPDGATIFGLLRYSVLRVMSYVQAGFAFLHYQFLDWISLQSVPFTATDEFLAAWGSLKEITQIDATFAAGTATFPGILDADLPNGTPIVRSVDGFSYVTTADAEVGVGLTVTAPIRATTAGSIGNCDIGTVLQLSATVLNIGNLGAAATEIVGGTDQELTPAYRMRVLAAFSQPVQGGDLSDYVEWAEAVAGVTRAWVAPGLGGAGSVTVFIMLDVAEAEYAGFPQGTNGTAAAETRGLAVATGDQLLVANALYPKRPATALVYVNGPTPQPVPFVISNLGANNTEPNQVAITAALQDMFLRLGNVGGAVSPQTGLPFPPLNPNSWYGALAAIPGLTTFAVNEPALQIVPAPGALLTLALPVTFET